jgi:orotidine-5'-phosphate decarboxylase
MTESRLIVALDFPDTDACERFLAPVDPRECAVKIGKELFVAGGPAFVRRVVERGFRVFLDLKFHDIPNTVASACRVAAELGVWMIDVHALGGRAMLTAAREALEGFTPRPRLIAVTVLTSMGESDLADVGIVPPVIDAVRRLAALAQECGSDGVVCSAQEAQALRGKHPEPFMLVTPGIRLAGGSVGDQVRVVTPLDAMRAGASHLVVGRPVTRAQDPLAVMREINSAIRAGMGSK